MKHDQIVRAYDRAAPEAGTEDRIWQAVSRAAERSAPAEKRRHPLLRRALLAAACMALLAALVGAGYAAYEKWKLPEPEIYVPDPDNNYLQIHTEATYTPDTASPSLPVGTDPDETPPAVTEPEALSDEFFLQRAKAILAQAGIDADAEATVTVRRQKNLYWDREEVEVSWPHDGMPISVSFDAERGVFLEMVGVEWVLDDVSACQTQAEADALARRYYESLPVEQGYVMANCEKYDGQFWSYDFCREVEPGLYSWYECVRVAINPVSGGLEFCKVFYVPLLDDHEPGDVPLTEEEAVEASKQNSGLNMDVFELVSVEKFVALPNWAFTDYDFSLHQKAAAVSRICWKVTYRNDLGIFEDIAEIWVDYYSGEILGGGMTG